MVFGYSERGNKVSGPRDIDGLLSPLCVWTHLLLPPSALSTAASPYSLVDKFFSSLFHFSKCLTILAHLLFHVNFQVILSSSKSPAFGVGVALNTPSLMGTRLLPALLPQVGAQSLLPWSRGALEGCGPGVTASLSCVQRGREGPQTRRSGELRERQHSAVSQRLSVPEVLA